MGNLIFSKNLRTSDMKHSAIDEYVCWAAFIVSLFHLGIPVGRIHHILYKIQDDEYDNLPYDEARRDHFISVELIFGLKVIGL